MNLRAWLQIGRAQTYPADWLLVMVPFLHGRLDFLQAFVLSVLIWFSHLLSFGHNSLLDSCIIPERGKPPPDFSDPSKQHHPLILGTISLHTAKNIIFWGLGCLTTIFAAFTLLIAENLPLAVTSLFLYYVWGSLYNEGLSKESPLGFISISLSFTFMATWAWFLTHKSLDLLGILYIGYVFFTILFQISWSGFVKEMQIRERSNILTRMGALLDVTWKGEKEFKPGKSIFYAYSVKGFNLFLGGLLLHLQYDLVKLVMYVLLAALALFYLHKLTKPRIYNRGKELLNMSLEEICTIYLVIPIMLGFLEASMLMAAGVLYFFVLNLILWGKPYPRV